MKRLPVLAFLLLAFAAVPLFAGQGKSGDKATGSVTYHNGGVATIAIFDAHEAIGNRGAKGTMLNVDQDFNFYLLELTCVTVDPANHVATFAGNVKYSNFLAIDTTIQFWVYDGGTPGSAGDKLAGDVLAPDCTILDPSLIPTSWIFVEDGNLTVQASN